MPALVAVLATTGVASAAPIGADGCGYGEGGPFADTLCWIDMTEYDDTTARTPAGQPMSVELPGGYTIEFTVRTSGTRTAHSNVFPTFVGAPVGNQIYTGTPGMPALYQTQASGDAFTTISLTDIVVTDSQGTAVHGWRFVGVDAEATFSSEDITFSADVPVSVLASYDPPGITSGCQKNVQQLDANTIKCSGTSDASGGYGTLLVSATEPTEFTQTMHVNAPFAAEAVAFAIQTATIEFNKAVAGRVAPTDSFTISVETAEGAVVGSADTGAANSATTGTLVVLPRVDGGTFTLRETGGAGTNLARYHTDWRCSVGGGPNAPVAYDVFAIDVGLHEGHSVACTVTNSPAPLQLAFTGSNDRELGLALTGGLLLVLGVGALRFGTRRRALQ
jgi:hypothetical protein